ncbi:MAG: hypothetical protein KA715_03720 [Xanthomonadaceae bacterium]|nr:hypothetical protein [Xanthomonadaceae bacterium]
MHTPYSYDACDSAGITGSSAEIKAGAGVINTSCSSNFREAICKNRIDYTFTTDHVDNFIFYDFSRLLLYQAGDVLINSGLGTSYYNRMVGCDGGAFAPVLSAGFETLSMIGIGLKAHLTSDPTESVRRSAYEGTTAATRVLIQSAPSEGVVIIPHTEDKSVATIQSLGPDAIELYNLHANLDPKIRKRSLGAGGYSVIGGMINYILDPFSDLAPDLAFITFLEQFSVYTSKWAQIQGAGQKITAVAAVDSHENVLAMKVADGERFDSYRRTSKIASNLVAVTSSDIDLVKTAIKNNRVLIAFEGFGSPVNFDFSATISGTAYRMGDTGTLGAQTATVRIVAPTLHPSSAQGRTAPVIRLILKRINTDGSETKLSETTNSTLTASVSTASILRAEVKITPYHLREYLGGFASYANNENIWIISNPIYLN